MRSDIIIEHEHWQMLPLRDFLAQQSIVNGTLPPPPISEINGEVNARVNQGRWIADCPCGGAAVVSSKQPFFYCPYCGNAGNGRKWLQVAFPQEKAEIEAELLKRPAFNGFHAKTRNWEGETMDTLKAESLARGVM